mgnify:CR=1 FL=1
MSNVLIGIIGVVLFIGLAIAGVLILGSDFLNATSESRAAAAVTQSMQVAQAVTMFNMKSGSPFVAANTTDPFLNLRPRFLKTVPVNPVQSNIPVRGYDANGQMSGRTTMVLISFDISNQSRDICLAAARDSGMVFDNGTNTTIPTTTTGAYPRDARGRLFHAGCYESKAAFGAIPANRYHIFQQV